jgi:anaerobic dimethyl sulfoxide reductase subunit B (iron-sulfur subunit)
MQKDAGGDGTVQHDDELCIGCGNCVKSCPYQIPVLLPDKGIAGKCDACKPFRDAGLNPVCVDACVMRCLDFGDTDELRTKYGGELTNALPILPSPDATQPNTLISPKQAALNADFKEVIL